MLSSLIKRYLCTGHRIRVFGILCFIIIYASASNIVSNNDTKVQAKPAAKTQAASPQGDKKKVLLRKSKTLEKREGFEPQILRDSVVLYHDGAVMYCDSAYLDKDKNSFEAFSNVQIVQGDTLFLYGNYLHYNGNTKLLMIRENVRLENRDVTLFTDSMNYDRVLNVAYYFDGGMLVDSANQLTSYWGQYEPNLRLATFSDSVILVNPNFTLYSDTLLYNTFSKVANILGPSTIVSDSGTIYTNQGWYNTATEESMLLNRSLIVNKEGNRTLTGDSISYHKAQGFVEVFGNMFLQDTLNKAILQGNYGYYNELNNSAMATDSAFCIDYSQKDSLFLHGDTLRLLTDSIYKEIKAYNNVRFFREDIQGVCDSMQFNSRDTMLYMYREPVVWNETHQLSGDTIAVLFNDSTIEHLHVKKYAFAVQDIDSVHYNQLSGREIQVFFIGGDARNIFVEGNAESIFYPEEKDKSMIGMNKSESSYISIDMLDKKVIKLKLTTKSSGTMTPLDDLDLSKSKLTHFQWFDYLRPKDRHDIFRKVKKKEGTMLPKSSAKFKQD